MAGRPRYIVAHTTLGTRPDWPRGAAVTIDDLCRPDDPERDGKLARLVSLGALLLEGDPAAAEIPPAEPPRPARPAPSLEEWQALVSAVEGEAAALLNLQRDAAAEANQPVLDWLGERRRTIAARLAHVQAERDRAVADQSGKQQTGVVSW